MTAKLPRIWIVTDPDHAHGPIDPLLRALEGVPAGSVGVQLRAKETDARTVVEWGQALREITRSAGSPLVVNQRADVALVIGADGVHLPERSVPATELRQAWPEFSLLGQSRHDRAGIEKADRDGVDYAFLSPVFDVPGKGASMGLDGFEAAVRGIRLPVYALGGITPFSAGELTAAGAYGVAVRRLIYRTAHPGQIVRELLDVLDKGGPGV